MIVTANVIDKKTGKRKDEYFLVRFDHSPVDKEKQKKHIPQRRSGICSIYYLSSEPKWVDAVGKEIKGEFFASRICGEKYKYFIVDQKLTCSENDNYCKAYSRTVTLQAVLNWIMKNQNDEDFLKTLPFKFDNETFKSFITTLNVQHPHGKDHAMSLLKSDNYRISKSVDESKSDESNDDQFTITLDVQTVKSFLKILSKLKES